MNISVRRFESSGQSWMAVARHDAQSVDRATGVFDSISRFSRVGFDAVYFEDQSDAARFIMAAQSAGCTISFGGPADAGAAFLSASKFMPAQARMDLSVGARVYAPALSMFVRIESPPLDGRTIKVQDDATHTSYELGGVGELRDLAFGQAHLQRDRMLGRIEQCSGERLVAASAVLGDFEQRAQVLAQDKADTQRMRQDLFAPLRAQLRDMGFESIDATNMSLAFLSRAYAGRFVQGPLDGPAHDDRVTLSELARVYVPDGEQLIDEAPILPVDKSGGLSFVTQQMLSGHCVVRGAGRYGEGDARSSSVIGAAQTILDAVSTLCRFHAAQIQSAPVSHGQLMVSFSTPTRAQIASELARVAQDNGQLARLPSLVAMHGAAAGQDTDASDCDGDLFAPR